MTRAPSVPHQVGMDSEAPWIESDADLVTRFREAGDRDALDQLFHRHRAALLGFLVGLVGDAQDGEDVAQRTLLKAYRSLASLRDPKLFRAWLYRIARNEGARLLKQNQRSRVAPAPLDEIAAREADLFGELERREFNALVARYAEALPLREREPVLLRLFANVNLAEAEQILGRPAKAISQQVQRGLGMLGRLLERNGHGAAVPMLAALALPEQAIAAGASSTSVGTGSKTVKVLVAASLLGLVVWAGFALGLWSTVSGESGGPVDARIGRGSAVGTIANSSDGGVPGPGIERGPVDGGGAGGRPMVFGRVTSAESGEPVAGASVELFDWVEQKSRRTVVDPDGAFEFPETAGKVGAFQLFVDAPNEGEDYRFGKAIVANVRARRIPLEVEMQPACSVSGIVVNAGTDEPIREFRVRVFPQGTEYAYQGEQPNTCWPRPLYPCSLWASLDPALGTLRDAWFRNDDGAWRIGGLAPGSYQVAIEAKGFRSYLAETSELEVGTTGAEDPVRWELQEGHRATDVHVDARDGRPIAGLEVRNGDQRYFGLFSARTDAEGRVASCPCDVRHRFSGGYATDSMNYDHADDQVVVHVAGRLTGRSAEAAAFAEPCVVVAQTDRGRFLAMTTTGEGGSWSIDELGDVAAGAPGCDVLVLDPTLTNLLSHSATELRGDTPVGAGGATLRIEAVDLEGPAVEASVYVTRVLGDRWGGHCSGWTGADGVFQCVDLVPGRYQVEIRWSVGSFDVTPDYHASWTHRIELVQGQSCTIRQQVGARAPVVVSVLGHASGQWFPGEVWLRAIGQGADDVTLRVSMRVQEDRTVSLPLVTPGTWRLAPWFGADFALVETGLVTVEQDGRSTLDELRFRDNSRSEKVELRFLDALTARPVRDVIVRSDASWFDWFHELTGLERDPEPCDGHIQIEVPAITWMPLQVYSPDHVSLARELKFSGQVPAVIEWQLTPSARAVVPQWVPETLGSAASTCPEMSPGDVILRVGERAVRSWGEIHTAVMAIPDEQAIPFTVLRDGNEVLASVRAARDRFSPGHYAPYYFENQAAGN